MTIQFYIDGTQALAAKCAARPSQDVPSPARIFAPSERNRR